MAHSHHGHSHGHGHGHAHGHTQGHDNETRVLWALVLTAGFMGAEVAGGTINKEGAFRFRATRVGADTALARSSMTFPALVAMCAIATPGAARCRRGLPARRVRCR